MHFTVLLQAAILAIVAAEHNSLETLITHSQNAAPHSAPYIVSIQSADNSHECTGSIINASWVLTAANCTINNFPFVVAGLYDLGQNESATEQRRFIDYARVYRHPQYSSVPEESAFDIALIRVDPPFVLNDTVQSVALPLANSIPSGKAQLYGWGSTFVFPMYPKVLQTGEVVIWSYENCLAVLDNVMQPQMLCAGPGCCGSSACYGDIGDPLLQDSLLVGFSTWIIAPCGLFGLPTGFTRISAFVEWIASVQRDHP